MARSSPLQRPFMITLLQQYFSESARRFPDKLAIRCDRDGISYADAEALTNGLARALAAAGVQRGSFVPFFMAKSVRSVLSILGALKADCAYVPIDIGSPAQRMLAILKATNAKVLLVDAESKARLESLLTPDERPHLINLSDFTPADTSPLVYRNISIDVAYVLFTSGSTGIPKGVMVHHKAVIDYIECCVETYDLTERDVMANHSPFHFDVSMFDLYTAFKVGATVHLMYDELNAVIPLIAKWLSENEITTLFCVPSVLTLLLKSRRLKPGAFPKLRHVICAGEVLPPDVLRAWMLMYPHVQFANMYGPTEITVTCSYHIFKEPPPEGATTVPIGIPRPNMEMLVRLENGRLSQEPGARGELLVRGEAVAYGYLGDETKTRNAFIQNPENTRFYDRLYKTGDLVEIAPDGAFMFLGRIDDQIKHMGYRIELGEIEAAMVSLEQVVEGVAVYGKGIDDVDTQIGALLSLRAGADLTTIRDLLKERLPSYMVPTRIVLHADEFPRTSSGKYDRKVAARIVFNLG